MPTAPKNQVKRFAGAQNGTMMDLLNPSKEMVSIATILNGLTRLVRYNGQAFIPERHHGHHVPIEKNNGWSVGEHTILVYNIAVLMNYPDAVRKAALLHDMHETWTGDIVSPMIGALHQSQNNEAVFYIQKGIQKVIEEIFEFVRPRTDEFESQLRFCDLGACFLEMQHFWPIGVSEKMEIVADKLQGALQVDKTYMPNGLTMMKPWNIMNDRMSPLMIRHILGEIIQYEFPHMREYDKIHASELTRHSKANWQIEKARMDGVCETVFGKFLQENLEPEPLPAA